MTTPTPTLSPEEIQRLEQYKSAVHYTSLGALIICPALIFVPPRTPLRTSILLLFTGVGANQLANEYSGESLLTRAQKRTESLFSTNMSERAQQVQAKLREEKHAQKIAREGERPTNLRALSESARVAPSPTEQEAQEERERREKGVLEKLWLGGEGEDWKQKRDQKEKEALEDGRGYGGLIADQIWEVWNWGKKEVEDVKEKDEEVLRKEKDKKNKP